jgi:peptidyl-prolyl cis-trans isomerase C
MAKGTTSVIVIRTQSGWLIIKLEDKRDFKVPSYRDSKERMSSSVIQKMLKHYPQELSKFYKIIR